MSDFVSFSRFCCTISYIFEHVWAMKTTQKENMCQHKTVLYTTMMEGREKGKIPLHYKVLQATSLDLNNHPESIRQLQYYEEPEN